jgi:cobalt/nickel transport system permease protein
LSIRIRRRPKKVHPTYYLLRAVECTFLGRLRRGFIERSIESALSFFKDAIFSDEIARSEGILQSFDTRLKLVGAMVLILAACFTRSIWALAGLYLACLVLAVLSRVKIFYFLKRTWVFIPIFTLFMAIPAVFMQSLYSAVIFVLRVIACVSFAVLLSVTTRHRDLLKGLAFFRIPGIFIQVLDMTYRYIFLFISVFEDMHLSLKSRLIKDIDAKSARYWIASRISYLFKRSMKMSEDVYLAMLARGYTGEFKNHAR